MRGGSDTAMMCCSSTDNPKDSVVGIDEEQLALFVEQCVFVVSEEVAKEPRTMFHAKGLKAVGSVPAAKSERQFDGVGIKEHLV